MRSSKATDGPLVNILLQSEGTTATKCTREGRETLMIQSVYL